MQRAIDLDYFRRRERQEHERAAQTPEGAARRIHEQLANEYATLVLVASGGEGRR